MVDLNNYKEVLDYLGQDKAAEKFYSEKVIKKLDKVLCSQIYLNDLFNYFISHKDNLKKVKLFTNDWYLIVVALLIEKDMYPKRFLIDPFYRLVMCINTWIVENKKAADIVLTKDITAKQYLKPGLLQLSENSCAIKN